MKVLQASKQLQIPNSNISGSPTGSKLPWGQLPITDPFLLPAGTGKVSQTTDTHAVQTDTQDGSTSPHQAGPSDPTLLTQSSTYKAFERPCTSSPVPSIPCLLPRERYCVYIHIIRKWEFKWEFNLIKVLILGQVHKSYIQGGTK